MIIGFLGFIFFLSLFCIIAISILKDMTKERKKIDGKQKSYSHINSYNEKVVPIRRKRPDTYKKRSR